MSMWIKTTGIRLLVALALNGLVGVAGHARETGALISESEARNIAWSAGLVHVEAITRTDDRWEISGRSVDDNEMILDIDIRNGRILD
ncbi:PepSY domain-containing protein [Bosea sp. F3-2]|nr:PepSY domain-containing protein [Bosea sp. F3-2]